MFMQSPIEGISLQTGIQLAHSTFGRCSHDRKTFPYEPGSTIELDTFGTANTTHTPRHHTKIARKSECRKNFDALRETLTSSALITNKTRTGSCLAEDTKSLTVNYYIVLTLGLLFSALHEETVTIRDYGQKLLKVGLLYEQTLLFTVLCELSAKSVLLAGVASHELSCCFVPILVAVVTVRALYAGTLVTCWTTAPSHQKRRSSSALLAALCLLLATLTIAARCYASKNATHPLAQLSSHPQSLSSITTKDSKFQTHSSKIVLSRFFKLPYKDTQSDTRVILRNSKNLLSTQNFKIVNLTYLNADYRKKRELQNSQDKVYNNFKSYDGKQITDQNSALYSVEVRSRLPETTEQSYTINNKVPDHTASSAHRHLRNQAAYRNKKPHIPVRNLEAETHSVKYLTDSNSKSKNHSDVVTSANGSDSAWNTSANSPQVSDTLQVVHRQNDQSLEPLTEEEERPTGGSGIERPMPPALDHSNNSLSSESAILVLVVSAVVLTVALGLVTCVLSHYRGGTAADPHDAGQTPTTAPMLSVVSAGAAAGVGGMDRLRGRGAARELAASRDRQVRLHAVHTDIAINLPPNIALPDGEDHPFNSSRLQIRDSEQESEIYQKCIKPPPNRTVLESESPPPYRSSSAGLLGSIGSSSSGGSSDWSGGSAPLVMRCHSMSSTSKRPDAGPSGQKTDFIQRTVKIFTGKKSQPPPAPTLPAVVVPTRPRQTSEQQQNSAGRPKPSV